MISDLQIHGSGLIIGAAVGYEWPQLEPFVASLLTRTEADLLLLLDKNQQAVLNAIATQSRLHALVLEPQERAEAMVVKRFFILRDLLRHLACNGQLSGTALMLSDTRDVLFQADPFQAPGFALNAPLLFAEEPLRLADCSINKSWIEHYFGHELFSKIAHHGILCAGTIIGLQQEMCCFLERLCELLEQRSASLSSVPWGLDQAALNILVRTVDSGFSFNIEDARTGRFLTIHHQQQIQLDRQGRLINQAALPFPVVHQYDRLSWLSRHLLYQAAADPRQADAATAGATDGLIRFAQ